GRVADALNDILENMQRLSMEAARVRREVGHEGKLDRRIVLTETTGSWYDLTNNINEILDELVHPMSEVTRVPGAVAKGDLHEEVDTEMNRRNLQGEYLRTARTVNPMVHQLGLFASEVTRVAREVGVDGILGAQAKVRGVAGTWKDLT